MQVHFHQHRLDDTDFNKLPITMNEILSFPNKMGLYLQFYRQDVHLSMELIVKFSLLLRTLLQDVKFILS